MYGLGGWEDAPNTVRSGVIRAQILAHHLVKGGARIRYHDLPSDKFLSYVVCTYSKSISTHKERKANIYLEVMLILINEYIKEEECVIECYY